MFGIDKINEKMTDFVKQVTGEGKEVTEAPEVKEVDEKYAKERQWLLWEVAESAANRRAPFWSKLIDVGKNIGIGSKHEEEVARQNEFESITAWTIFVPDFLLKHVTNNLIKIPGFETLVKNYPLGAKPKDNLLDESGNLKKKPNPDDVVNFLRMVNQDIIMGKVVVNKATGTGQYKTWEQAPQTPEPAPASQEKTQNQPA